MSTTTPPKASATGSVPGAPPPRGLQPQRILHNPWLHNGIGAAAVLAAMAPLLVLAGIVIHRKPRVDLVADQALVQLTAINAGHHAQLLGPYSRFGWHHPGPSWFYILDGAFLPLGSHGWSLLAATLLLHAVVAAAMVLVVWRWRGAVAAVLAALLVLVFLRTLGGDILINPWNPYAIVLPTALLLLLAGATATGSAISFAGLLLVASFVVQTHVSTVPAVGLAVIVAAVLGVAAARRRQRDDLEPYIVASARRRDLGERLHLCGGVLLVLLLALMWIPPALEQVNDRPGNLRAIVDFFRHHGGDHSLAEGIGAAGRNLTAFPFGSYDQDLGLHLGSGQVRYGVALGLFLVACAALIWLASRAGDGMARGIGAACLVAALAATWSVTRITGPVDAYLLTWVTALPLALAAGYAALLAAPGRIAALAARAGSRGVQAWRAAGPLLAAVAAACTIGVLAGQTGADAAVSPQGQAPYWAAPTDDLVSLAVSHLPGGTVRISTDPFPAWPVATALTVRLVQDGRRVVVPDQWVALWGDQFAAGPGTRTAVEVLVRSTAQSTLPAPPPGAQPVASVPGVDIFVIGAAGGG
jgi:hypothetical protein